MYCLLCFISNYFQSLYLIYVCYMSSNLGNKISLMRMLISIAYDSLNFEIKPRTSRIVTLDDGDYPV